MEKLKKNLYFYDNFVTLIGFIHTSLDNLKTGQDNEEE